MTISYRTKEGVVEDTIRYASLLLEEDKEEIIEGIIRCGSKLLVYGKENEKDRGGIDDLVAQSEPSDEKPENVVYGDNDGQERQNNYGPIILDYIELRQIALHDFTDRVPGKHVDTFPESAMPGVLGFTYLGQARMALRDDLSGDLKTMVDIHESIHTNNEYETRILTSWMMSKEIPKYIK